MGLFKLSFILVLMIFCGNASADTMPFIEKGTLDLSHWDFNKDGIVKISDGPDQDLNPSYYDKENDSAEFYIKIILPEKGSSSNQADSIALLIPPLLSPYYFWINDNIGLSNGYNYIARWKVNYRDKSNILPVPDHLNPLKLYLKIFDYSNIKIIRETILIGLEKDIREHRWLILFREGIIDGALLLIFIFNLLLLLGNRKNYAFLILSLFAFIQALNLVGRGETLNFLSDISADLLIKIQIILLYAKLFLINALFIYLFFKSQSRAIFRIISAVFILIIISLTLPVNWVSLNYILSIYYILLLAGLAFNIFISAYFIKKDRLKSIVFLLSSSILLFSYLIYIIQNKIYTISLTVLFIGQQDTLGYGILLFTIVNTYYLYITVPGKIKEEPGLPIRGNNIIAVTRGKVAFN